MPSCAFKECTNHSRQKNKAEGVGYHSFPRDALWRHKWLEVVRRQRCEPNWLPSQYSRVCSMHFEPADFYETSKGLTRITKGAVPCFRAAMTAANYALSRSCSPNSLQNENISDLESIFDTPRKAFLESKIRKVIKEKKQLFKQNKNLKRRNKRLSEICKSLKESILRLKKVMRLRNNVLCKM